jgi:predicted regulator of Ras-like GTPase activity (Roadblock/LC7/MglB family)
MNERGGFPISVLTDRQGFPIASAASPGFDPDTKSAVVALVQKTATQVRDQLGLTDTDEIALSHADGQRLICRPFSVKGHDMILAIMIPDREKSYRRLTNQTVNAIRRLWKL